MLRKLLIYSVFVICSLASPSSLFSQENDLNFINFGSREGLSSNNVTAIIKDSHGYMWFATDDGLNKFDGTKFKVYRHNSDDSTSLASNEIIDLYEDKKGNLWIGTGVGLTRYNRKMDSFENFYSGSKSAITSISSDKAGLIWLTSYGGVSVFDPQTRKVSALNPRNLRDKSIFTQSVLRVFCDSKGRVWLCTGRGLALYSKNSNSAKFINHSETDATSIANKYARSIAEDINGRLWFGTDGGLSMLKTDGTGFINYYNNPADKNSLSSNLIYAVATDKAGKVWIGTEEGLNILDPVKHQISRISHSPRNRYSLVGKAVKTIYIDKNGIYWVGTFRAGVNKYDKNLPFFNLQQSNAFDPQSLNSSVVTSFAEVSGKGVYVGTDGGGLSLFDAASGLFHTTPLSKKNGSTSLAILAIERNNSDLWIGTYLNGIYILNTQTGAVKRITKESNQNSFGSNDIFCFKKDSQGNMWVGTNGQGVDCYDAAKGTFIHFNKAEQGGRRILQNGYIRSIEEDKEGNIWIGSMGAGIVVYNPLTGRSRNLNKQSHKLPHDNALSICSARNGVVWVGTPEGLAYYDPRLSRFICYSEKDGLANAFIYKVIEDNAGMIWASTNSGISSLDPKTKKFRNFSYYNGLQRGPFVQGSGLKLADGRLFFGGIDGFNYFNPRTLNSNKNVPNIVLTDLKISNQSVVPSEDAEIKEHISIAREIRLDYKQNFTLSFAALNYTSPQENRYLYKLENFDKDWNRVGAATTAAYTNLDPGKYTFKVKATSDAGEWTTPETSVVIYVQPPIWRTWYAYVFYIALVASILWLLRYRGIKKLEAKFAIEQERLQVQQLIEQQRREAEHLHEFDQLKIKFLTNLSHEFRTPISLIVGPVEQLLQLETSSDKSSQLSMIRRNARRLLNLVNQLLDFRNLEGKELKLKVSEADFVAFARDVAESFRDLSGRKQINFEFRSSLKYYFARFDQDKMERVLFNLLSNAFKFTLKGGEIILSVDKDTEFEGLKITLNDSGVGIEASAKDKIFDRFFQSEANNEVINQGSGIGLSITKEFIKLHGGSIHVESISGQGSTFTIRLPLNELKQKNGAEAEIAEEPLSVDIPPSEEIAETTASAAVQLPTILIVEDNEDFRYYLKDNLKTFYRIVEAGNGVEGWQKVLSSHPQLVVSDISMPQMSGIELCKKIKSDKRSSHIPVLLLTALTGEDDQLLGLETGANDYMTKPFNFNILNIKIRNLLTLNEQFKNTYSKQLKVATPDLKIESENEKLLSRVIEYVESNLTNPQLSVEDLSRKLGMSRGSLYTKILEFSGETPVEFIRSVKLDRAVILLEKSDMNIAQISYAVGFSTPNYFARSFKTRFNMLPSEFIQLKRVNKGQSQ